jgi:HKD family nuclease
LEGVVTSTTLKLQNPEDVDSEYLLEVLLNQSINAERGGAAYAWATSRGVSLLFEDSVFQEFLGSGSFHLIVGVDAVTTPATLEALAEAEHHYSGLWIQAFMSADNEGLFHPKFAWFEHQTSGSLIVGSGNLTGGGLWDNREAFTVSEMEAEATQRVQQQWEAWKISIAARLYPLLDSQVLEKAALNTGWTLGRRSSSGGGRRSLPAVAPEPTALPRNDRELLIAEIPKSGNRWKQANFDRHNYEEFFGARVGTQRRMLFQSVDGHGATGEVESRPSVEVASRNWRFELNAASGLDYPTVGRPIGVFLRLRARTFLYYLSLPGSPWHEELVAHLESSDVASADIRRLRETTAEAASLAAVQLLLRSGEGSFIDDDPA